MSIQLLTERCLIGAQEGFGQLAFPTRGQPGESFEPPSLRNLRFGLQPFEKHFQWFGGDFTLVNAVNQVAEQSPGQVARRTLGMGNVAVEAALQFLL